MPTLRPFWKLLETRPRPEAVLSEWRTWMGDGFQPIHPLLKATGEVARSYPNPRPHGLPLRVVRHRDGSVVAVCTEGEGTRIALASTDLAVYAVDFGRLRSALAQALALATSRAPYDDEPVVLPVGQWEPKPAASFPVTLVRATSVPQARDLIYPLVATAPKPTLVLTPTREHWADDMQDFCKRYKCLVAPLDEIVTAEDASLAADPDRWQAYLEPFCGYADLTLPTNFTNKRPRPKRAVRTAKIEAVRKELVEHIRAARDHAFSALQRGDEPALLNRPAKSELGRRAGLKPYDVTRCFRDEPQLEQLWRIAGELDQVMQYGR